jgi:2-dehydro-3-deoxygluconokinase
MSVLTVGETMALLDPLGEAGVAEGETLTLRSAGAESNFAIALSRLGVPVAWVSRLGADPLGDMIAATLAGEGVDLRWVRRSVGAPTGLYLKWRTDGRTRVMYYRADSAARGLEPADVPAEALDGVSLVHLTGITMALSATARELVVDVARRARERGAVVSFDPNWRPPLWSSAQAAAAAQLEVLPYVDWYLCGEEEGSVLFDAPDAAGVLDAARDAGARSAVVRIGARGAVVAGADGPVEVPPLRVESVVDEVGAGDAFAAGFAYGLLQGWSVAACARGGNVLAATALAGTGDWETLPRLQDVEHGLRPTGSGSA